MKINGKSEAQNKIFGVLASCYLIYNSFIS